MDEYIRECSSRYAKPKLVDKEVHFEDIGGHLSRYAALFEY